LTLLLAVRLLAPTGFMPAFERSGIAIVICPDGGTQRPALMHHHSGKQKGEHQPCPYAAASPMDATPAGWGPLVELLIFYTALLLGRAFLFIERHRVRGSPPTRGPPLLT